MANQPSDSPFGLAANYCSSIAILKADRDNAALLKRTCQTCGKVVCRASDLSRHMLIHSGVKEHVCRQCNKAFTQKSALKTHMNIHTGATPYACEYCYKAFRDPSVRSRHIEEQHLQKKTLHECKICAEREDGSSVKYRRKDVLRRHLKTKHGITMSISSVTLRAGPIRRRQSCKNRTAVTQALASPDTPPAILDQDDPGTTQKAQLHQFRPTRRAAVRATEILASIIQEEDLTILADDDDDEVGGVEAEPLPTGMPIFPPSYSPFVLSLAPSSLSVIRASQSTPRGSLRNAPADNLHTPSPISVAGPCEEISPRDSSFVAIGPSQGTSHSSFGAYLKEHRRRCSSLYLVSPVTSPASPYFGPQGSSHFMSDRILHPPLCIDPSVLQHPDRDDRTLFNNDFRLNMLNLGSGSRSSMCEAF